MLNFVVARYKEGLEWLHRLPAHSRTIVYNKGPELYPGTLPSQVRVVPLPNVGRETDTYLHFLGNDFDAAQPGFTVFTQGDPFGHSPHFLELMAACGSWRDVQPLSIQWLASENIPPASLIDAERRDWIGTLRVRAEHFDLATWAPLGFLDVGAWRVGSTYRQLHRLPEATNLAAHFLGLCGLPDLARSMAQAKLGRFSYGAIFAVRNSRVQAFLASARPALARMRALNLAAETHGYMFERCWLHLFGEPAIDLSALPLARASGPSYAAPIAEAFDRSLASTPGAARSAEVSLRQRCSLLREAAYAASRRGGIDDALSLLTQALALEPRNPELVCDLSALALDSGEPANAATLARHALTLIANHGGATFMLALSLKALGDDAGASAQCERLRQGPAAEHLTAHASELSPLVRRCLGNLSPTASLAVA